MTLTLEPVAARPQAGVPLPAIFFLYHEDASARTELIGRAHTEALACALAMRRSSLTTRTIAVKECTPATGAVRWVADFRAGVLLSTETAFPRVPHPGEIHVHLT